MLIQFLPGAAGYAGAKNSNGKSQKKFKMKKHSVFEYIKMMVLKKLIFMIN